MKEAQLAMRALEELNRRECNGHVRFRVGRARVRPEKFRNAFKRFSRGTYFEDTRIEIETVQPVAGCDCGYNRRLSRRSYLPEAECPRCGDQLTLQQGEEFEIVEPQ
ncbi:MAG: hydrogenase/urease maturation nickel metallochaperone HypA [Candidatus Nanohaloarchaea archaeon]|nr:hydrogenase/urease maturation nickel metallochaperone HypA [Candidatus Nanohaloarchaea archaeon]